MLQLLKKSDSPLLHAKMYYVIILAIFVTIGYILDLSTLHNTSLTNFANLAGVGIIIISTLLTYISIFSSNLTFGIILYSLILNIILSFYLNFTSNTDISASTIRSALIVAMLLPVSGFVLGKIHTLIIGSLLLLLFILTYLHSNDEYIKENFDFLVVITIAYSVGIYYLIHLFESIASNQAKLISSLEAKNSELENVNSMLSDKNYLIERQKEELRSINVSKDTLYSVISHDIKNPLFNIINFCSLIKEKIRSKQLEKVGIYANMIHISANNLYRLVINLLDWTRLQGGKLNPDKKKIEVNANIKDTMNLFNDSAIQKDILLELNLNGEIEIFADINMFNTILRNLVSNAIKFTPSGGKVVVSSHLESGTYHLDVSDTGSGINPEDIELILNSKFNVSTIGTAEEGGTGLGLVLCKEFIGLHNGKLAISSIVGSGSTFSVSLPVQSV